MSVSHNRDYSVSSARFIAMCFIIICHMMQRDDFASDINGAHISWAFWFNVGVQMFLFLSGYLYSGKDNIDTVPFYKKNFPKLLTDYYVFIVIMLVVMNFSSLPGVSTPPRPSENFNFLWSTSFFCIKNARYISLEINI